MRWNFELDFNSRKELGDGLWSLPVPDEYRTSDYALEQLFVIEELRADLDLLQIMISMQKFYGSAPSEKALRVNIEAARSGLAMFLGAVNNGGPWLTRKLMLVSKRNESKSDYFFKESDIAFGLDKFISRADRYVDQLEWLLRKDPPNKGRGKNLSARDTAATLVSHFDHCSISISGYQSSPYMKALRIVLKEVHPEIPDEAYRRHGPWAIKKYREISQARIETQ